MQVVCQGPNCGTTFEAKRSTAKYCSGSCRARASQAVVKSFPAASKSARAAGRGSSEPGKITAATKKQLEAAGRDESVLGVQALVFAEMLDSAAAGGQTGAAIAALSREFRAVLEDALDGAKVAGNPLDEIRARRERRLNAG